MGSLAPSLNRAGLLRVVFILLMFVWPLALRNDYAVSVMVMAGLYATLTVGLGLLLGQAGQISFGHAAFFGLGAYTNAILTTKYNLPPLVAIVVGAVGAGLVAYIVGRPVLRLRFYFLALATIGLGMIFVAVVRELRGLTSGTWGMAGIPWLGVGGFVFDSYLKQYYLVWSAVFALWLFTERALSSRVGRALRALAVSEVAASTLGIYTADWKLRTFVVSAVYAGIGGGLYAFTLTAIHPNDFTVFMAIVVVIMVMVGGMNSLFGAILGTILMTWVGRAFTGYQEYSGGLYAVVLILLLIFLPGGITGGLRPTQVALIRRLFGFKPETFSEETKGRVRVEGPSAGHEEETETDVGLSVEQKKKDSGTLQEAKAKDWTPPNGEPLLHLEGIRVDFGGLRALNSVSLKIAEHTITALIGPNGAGKTTLFNVVSGLQRPAAGKVRFAGVETTSRSAADIAHLGMARTFQNLRVFENMTVLENVMVGRHRHESAGYIKAGFGLRSHFREERESREQGLKALALMGLENRADLSVTSLPYGEQRMVEIARALATEPRLLLLDEPAAGMNASERKQLVKKISHIRKAGVTVLLVEHNMELVMGISDIVSVLDYGRFIAKGRPEEVQAHPAVIEAYLGVRHERSEGEPIKVEEPASPGRAASPGQEKGEMLLRLEGLSTSYGAIRAVKDVTLGVEQGKSLVVLGANGAGKTTLLRTVSGVIRPQQGCVIYQGRDITKLEPPQIAMAGIGHVPEGRHVFPTLSVGDNLRLGACKRRDRIEIQKSAGFVYELFPVLKDRHKQVAGTLSGGEQQMLAIGRALMGDPKLLLLDEPSMGLAPLIVDGIFQALAALNRGGLTFLMVEQNAEIALSVAHDAVVLHTGSVALSGSAAELRRDERLHGVYLGVKE